MNYYLVFLQFWLREIRLEKGPDWLFLSNIRGPVQVSVTMIIELEIGETESWIKRFATMRY